MYPHPSMRVLFATVLIVFALGSSACVTMEDCCECLALADALSCNDPHQECVDKCFELCEPTRACYCSSAIEVGCAAECGCSR